MDLCRLELGRVRDELRKGRQAATNLLGLIRQQQKHFLSTSSSLNIPASSDLVLKIVDSFSNSLSIMLAGCQDPEGTGSRKSSSFISSGGRGCPKPRKGYLWTQVTSSVTADGYAWKKYGQKSILNAKHPRNYYKCIKNPHCQALKRVQKMNDDSYKITHTSHHTCETYSSPSSLGDKEEESAIQQPADSSRNASLLGIMEPIAFPEWSLDDLDFLLGSVEFNDHQDFQFL